MVFVHQGNRIGVPPFSVRQLPSYTPSAQRLSRARADVSGYTLLAHRKHGDRIGSLLVTSMAALHWRRTAELEPSRQTADVLGSKKPLSGANLSEVELNLPAIELMAAHRESY